MYGSARLGCALAAASCCALVAAPLEANGKFPSADQIVIDPSTPAHVVVRTSFGLVVTDDAGAS